MHYRPLIILSTTLCLIAACGTTEPSPEVTEDATTTAMDVIEPAPAEITVPSLLISEHSIADIPMNKAHHDAIRENRSIDDKANFVPYQTCTKDDMHAALATQELTPRAPQKVERTVGMPRTYVMGTSEVDHALLVSYEKNGTEVLQITTDPDDPQHIEHVVFMHKGHTDEYNVQPGMKGHEARKMRKELKHMTHKGQLFLYEEDSNITYRMRTVDPNKHTYTDSEINDLEIDAIVWQNKNERNHKGA